MLILALLLAAAEPRSLAVLEFKNKLANEPIDTGYLTDQVRGAALGAGALLRVITRENLLTLLAASGKDIAACEGECEVETGRRIGADLVISGELLKFGSSYKLDMRLHDTADARLLSAATASGTTVDELDKNLDAAVQKLLAPLNGAPASRPQPEADRPQQLGMSRARLLSMTIDNGESNTSFSISLQHAGGTATCDKPIAGGETCYLRGLEPGQARLKATGTAAFEQSFVIPEEGGKLIVYKAGHGGLYFGIPMLIGGAVLAGITFSDATSSTAATGGNTGAVAGFTLACVAAGSGLIAIIVDLAISHGYQVVGPMPR